MSDSAAHLCASRARELLETLRPLAGDSLRCGVHYHGRHQTVLDVRDDVAESYDDDEIACLIDDLALEAFGDPTRLTDLYRLGDLEATARWFGDGVLVHYPYSDASGVAVTFDHDVGCSLRTLIATGAAFLDGP
ncbi:hypothetical protein [Halorussus marinus]|uniref:hypothetical protein n=1 Tax=Halorussus marinus TaxID=2505976 RepID=UPI00106E1FAE|nr:hypothetical protein [Halorussus marinus]